MKWRISDSRDEILASPVAVAHHQRAEEGAQPEKEGDKGGGEFWSIAPGVAVTMDLILVNDANLAGGGVPVYLDTVGVGASNTPPPPLVALPSFSSGAPDGPTGKFGGVSLSPLPPGVYDLGDISYRGVATGSVRVAIVVPLGSEWVDQNSAPVPVDVLATADIEVSGSAPSVHKADPQHPAVTDKSPL